MLRNLFILTLVVFAFGSVNISAQAENKAAVVLNKVINDSAISMPKPVYPPSAIAVRAAGTVNVEVLVDENGDVIEAAAVSGHPLLRQASVQAAREAKFKPSFVDGKAVKLKGIIVYNFTLPEDVDADRSSDAPLTGVANRDTESSGGFIAKNGGVLNGGAVSLPRPPYPAVARAVKASGAVNVQVVLDENGNVEKAEAVSGHPLLRAAAVKAALGAKFKPTILDGQPVKVNGIIIYNFVP